MKDKFNLKKWFVIEVGEGARIPRFFLPIQRRFHTRTSFCWIFYLAIPVMMWLILTNIIYSVWSDLTQWLYLLRKNNEEKSNDTK